MPRKKLHLGKPMLAMALIALAWLIAPFALKLKTRNLFYEFQAPAWVALSYLRDMPLYWSMRAKSKNELIEAGRDMARLSAAYELRNQKYERMRSEMERLERLLGLPQRQEFRYEIARVIRRDLSAWQQELTIRKGKRHGVKEGMGVVFADGVVGRIKKAGWATSIVELASSRTFRMAAHFEGDSRPVAYQGAPSPILAPPRGRVSHVGMDLQASPAEPLRLVSSRLGGVFPDGLTIGEAVRLEPGADGLFQSGEINVNPLLLSVREVAVLAPVEPMEEEEEEDPSQ